MIGTGLFLVCPDHRAFRRNPLWATNAWLACVAFNADKYVYNYRLIARRRTGWTWLAHIDQHGIPGIPLERWHAYATNNLYFLQDDYYTEIYKRTRRINKLQRKKRR